MDVMIVSPAVDFNFDSTCTSPYMSSSPSSSPQRCFFSAPTSPNRDFSFFRDFHTAPGGSDTGVPGGSPATIPFSWEEKPGIRKTKDKSSNDDDFEFDFSGQLERTSISAADELFDGGKIKPLKPPPPLHYTNDGFSAASPKSPMNTKTWREALSPRPKRDDFDPFAAAIEQSRRGKSNSEENRTGLEQKRARGRGMTNKSSSMASRKKGTRSLSPFRVCDIFFESESYRQRSNFSNGKSSSKKWRLRDLFRSASEGRAGNNHVLKKSSGGDPEDAKDSSMRSTESGGGSVRRRRRGVAAVSAHERHYAANRAVAEEMRKKTVLPYKHGLLGCLGFNGGIHDITRGLGSLTRG